METESPLDFRKRLEDCIDILLKEGSSGQHTVLRRSEYKTDVAKLGAFNFLRGNGYITVMDEPIYLLTSEGWAFAERRKHPRWDWCKRNWFPLLIAASTVAAQLAAAVLNAWWGG